MKSVYFRIRIAAIGAPVLILLYGLLRLIDVIEGNQSHGFAWNLGHVLFFISFILFGGLTVELRQLVPGKSIVVKVVAYLAMVASLFGTTIFLWGILGDLMTNVAPVPRWLKLIGPLLFQVGMLGLLVMLVATRPRQLPIWTPILVLIGFLVFATNLNLLPIGAFIILFGLSPLVIRRNYPEQKK